MTEYEFGDDGVPEIVLAASDGLLETYVWIYEHDLMLGDYDISPLSLGSYSKGESEVWLSGDRIELPYGA